MTLLWSTVTVGCSAAGGPWPLVPGCTSFAKWDSEIKSDLKKEVTECKIVIKMACLIQHVTLIFPRRQFLDESRCVCADRWSAFTECYVFTLSQSANVWSVIFSTFYKIPRNSLLADLQTTSSESCLSCLFLTPNPPFLTNPPLTPILQQKGPHPKCGERDEMVVVCLLLRGFYSSLKRLL